MANQSTPSGSAASTTARAVESFVAAVEARGGEAEVTARGSVKIVTVTAAGKSTAVRIKATGKDEWQARRTESIAGKAGADVWALIDLADGAPVALVAADEYAKFVAKLIGAWEAKNPGKEVTANTQFAVTGDDVAAWEDAWSLVGLGADGAPAKPAPAKPAAKKTPAKKTPAKSAAKPAAKPAAKTPAKPAAKAPAKPAAKVPAKDAKITPIAEQKDAAAKGKTPATIEPKQAEPTKPEPKKAEVAKPEPKKAAAKETKKVEAAKSEDKPAAKKPEGHKQPTGIALLLKRLPVVGRLI
ncbi:hypothetical protein [Tsukamurella soli]|uniref:Lsr2 protein n=1 Tax=Tsukamurella soli TaxID=644556 RepID=A0ABP8JPS1_9ACTN